MTAIMATWSHLVIFWVLATTLTIAEASKLRCVMYLTGQHNVVPKMEDVAEVTHVSLAFMRSEIFNNPKQDQWPLFISVEEVRTKFARGTVIQIAVGGWGDTDGFSKAAKTPESREIFAQNIKSMVDATGADGVDIDWEYPGGNGEDYRINPNSEKAWEIDAYPKLLAEIRASIGPAKTMSAAVPGLPRDMLAFTHSTLPKITKSLDFLNVMTYDLMNRRDEVTNHHTGRKGSLEAIKAYIGRGVPREQINLGLAFYIKWFKTAPGDDCSTKPVGCIAELMEDAVTGADLGRAGAFSWHDQVPSELASSFNKAMEHGSWDKTNGGRWYWGGKEDRIFWSWDSEDDIRHKIIHLVGLEKLGGVFAWGLGEDAPDFKHLKAAIGGLNNVALEMQEEKSEL